MHSMRLAENGREAEISYLNFPLIAIDEDVVTFKVSMDNWRVMAMQIDKAIQYLSTPMLNCSNVHSLMFLPKSVNSLRTRAKSEIEEKEKELGVSLKWTYCLRVPEVNISVTKLMLPFETSTQEVKNFMMLLCLRVLRR